MAGLTVENLRYHIIVLLFAVIYLQQVLTVNIGGSLKIYEVLLAILLSLYLVDRTISDRISLSLFFFFVLCPLAGMILYYMDGSFNTYYERFPEARVWQRFNPGFAPLMIFLYDLMNWIGFNSISSHKKVFQNRKKIVKLFLYSGCFVIIYALYAHYFIFKMNFPDIIPDILDSRNSLPEKEPRISGFSAEPGTFIFLLSWMLLYLVYLNDIFTRQWIRYSMIFLVLWAIFLTMSSAIVGIFLSFLIYCLLCWKPAKIIRLGAVILAITTIGYLSQDKVNISHLKYSFVDKIERFISGSNHTSGSGAMRSYTAKLGYELFKDFPIFGVGSGNSYFFLWRYEHDTSTIPTIEKINHSTPPQNSHSKILSERGLVGYLFLLIFFVSMILKSRRQYLNGAISKNIFALTFISTTMLFIMMFSIYPIYSFFLWLNTALMNNMLKFSERKNPIHE